MQLASQLDRLRREVPASGLAPGAGQVSLVVDEIDHREDLAKPVAELVGIGDPHRDLGQRLPGTEQPLAHGGLTDQEGRGDLRRAQPADRAQRDGYLRLARQRRMTTCEY